MFMKMNGLFAGFGFFADPIIWRAASYLNRKFPHWQKLLEIRNTLLKGVPTNAQLTVTLLRIGEVNKAPLPPPPYSGPPPPNAAHETAGQNLEHLGVCTVSILSLVLTGSEGVPNEEIADAVHPDAAVTTGTDVAPKKKQHGRRILAAIKGVAKGGVETALGTDRLKAAAGGEHAKNRLGVLKSGGIDRAGPVDFPCRFKGKKGHAYITSTATTPALSWTTEKEDVDPVFSIAISDIQVSLNSIEKTRLADFRHRKSRKSEVLDGRLDLSWGGQPRETLPMVFSLSTSKEARSNSRLWNFGKSFSIVLSLWEIRCGKPGKKNEK